MRDGPDTGGGVFDPAANEYIYNGFRISHKKTETSSGSRQVPDFTRPGTDKGTSLTRWVKDNKTYEMFANIVYVRKFSSSVSGVPTTLYEYKIKYWWTLVGSGTGQQGTLPVPGSPKTAINDSAFDSSGYYYGGPSSSSQPPVLNIFLPKTVTTTLSPRSFVGWGGAPLSGPGTKSVKGKADTSPQGGDRGNSSSAADTPKDENSRPLKNYTLYMNPPPIRFATGAFVAMDTDPEERGGVDGSENGFRQAVLGPGTFTDRMQRKGWIAQYTRWSGDWNTDSSTKDVPSKDKDKVTWNSKNSILEDKVRYGFRFHYNPGQIDFGMGEYLNINPAVLLSSKTSVMPITLPENPPSVTLNLLLNRTEDVGIIGRRRVKGGEYRYFVNTGDLEGLNPYGVRYSTEYHLRGIATRGTMWDLEFLFRTGLGRPMPTAWRGKTADLGIFFGVPIVLHLSDAMTYTGRITSIAYSHTSFTMDMVPILTSVSINVTRLPDAVSFGANKPKDGKK